MSAPTRKSAEHAAPLAASHDPHRADAAAVWRALRAEVEQEMEREPLLRDFLRSSVLDHDRIDQALCLQLAEKLAGPGLDFAPLRHVMLDVLAERPDILAATAADLQAVLDRDPACTGYWITFLYFKGFHALQAHRIAHELWAVGRRGVASHIQSRCSQVFGVDIHPAARIGRGIFIDHATSVVIGETAVVEDDVSMLHEVTLGGTGNETGDRHPKVRRGVLICAGAKVLGNVEVGEGAKVGAGSVVLEDVPPHSTVAGVPARVVGRPAGEQPALDMDAGLPRGTAEPDGSE